MVSKVELKRQYKDLVRSKKLAESYEKLKEIWGKNHEVLPQKVIPNELTPQIVKKKYTKEELERLSFLELRKLGYNLGTKDRSKENLIKEILALQ